MWTYDVKDEVWKFGTPIVGAEVLRSLSNPNMFFGNVWHRNNLNKTKLCSDIEEAKRECQFCLDAMEQGRQYIPSVPINIHNLKNGQIVKYRLGLHGEHEVNWHPWKWGPVFVEKSDKPVKHGKTTYPAGIHCLSPKDENWASYDLRKYCSLEGGILFLDAEQFCMEIDYMASFK